MPTPTLTPTPTPVPVFTITEDDFEYARISGGTGYWQTDWRLAGRTSITDFISRGRPHSGKFHLSLRSGGAEARRAADLSRETNVRLQFWAKANSFEPGNTASLLICSQDCEDDANLVVLKVWEDGEDDGIYHFYDLIIPGGMLKSKFEIMFRTGIFDLQDWLFVDDIRFVSTLPGPTPTPTRIPVARRPAAPRIINLTAENFKFTPQSLSVKAGGQVTFNATNTSPTPHTFTVVPSKLDRSKFFVNLVLPSLNDTASKTITVERGIISLYFYCTIGGGAPNSHEDRGMSGTITVNN